MVSPVYVDTIISLIWHGYNPIREAGATISKNPSRSKAGEGWFCAGAAPSGRPKTCPEPTLSCPQQSCRAAAKGFTLHHAGICTRPFADHAYSATCTPLIKLPIRPPPRGHACYRRRLSACLPDIFISIGLHRTGCHSRFSPRSHQGFDHIAPTLSRLLACSPTLLPSRPGATGNGQTGQSFPR